MTKAQYRYSMLHIILRDIWIRDSISYAEHAPLDTNVILFLHAWSPISIFFRPYVFLITYFTYTSISFFKAPMI